MVINGLENILTSMYLFYYKTGRKIIYSYTQFIAV